MHIELTTCEGNKASVACHIEEDVISCGGRWFPGLVWDHYTEGESHLLDPALAAEIAWYGVCHDESYGSFTLDRHDDDTGEEFLDAQRVDWVLVA